MNLFKFNIKLIIQILFVIIFFSQLNAKNAAIYNNEDDISDYFSGILLLNNNQYNESYKFLKKLNGLEESHLNYSSRYLYSLINLGKFNEAFNYSKKLEINNLNNFESDLIIGIHHLKNENFELARKYFQKLKNKNSKFVLNNFLSDSLLNWSTFDTIILDDAKNKIKSLDSRFENLKKIQNTFLHCFYQSSKTDLIFKKITSDTQVDFSRYNYFYATYLTNSGKIDLAKQVIDSSLKLHPRNLLLNQYRLDLNSGKNNYHFNCQNQSHVAAEILYITANALSAQSIYAISNFYLNLAKYLNANFYSFNTLLAENFYKINNLEQAKKIYDKIGKKGSAFTWYASKQKARILIQEKQSAKALQLLKKNYDKLLEKNIYATFDYAKFLKNNEQFENSIIFYSEIINKIDTKHPLYSEVMEGRGVAYERIGEWDKAEKDLLASLDSSPDQAYVINYLAYSWIEKGLNIDQSLKMLEKANDLKSNDPYIIDSLGWALFKLKRYIEAKNYLKTAVQLMPSDPVVNDHYGDVLWKNGNKIQARYYWKNVLSLQGTKEDLKDIIKNKMISGL